MKRAPFVIGGTLLALGFLAAWLFLDLTPVPPVPETYACTHAGRTYALGERRGDGEGCDACLCGERGWDCPGIACPNADGGIAVISGTLSFPSEFLPAQRVCAEAVEDGDEQCVLSPAGNAAFSLAVPPGAYRVYAVREGDAEGKRAYHSEFVACGMTADCLDHTPIVSVVESGAAVQVDPQDWHAAGQADRIEVSPSRFVYQTHSYYPTSSFFLRGRGFTAVEFHATPYPPRDGAPFVPVGTATLASDEGGRQVWSLSVPAGFEAMRVKAKAFMDGGAFLWSPELRLVRPMEIPDTGN